MIRVRIICLIFMLGPVSQAYAEPAYEIDPRVRWHEPYVTLLDVDFVETGFHGRWEYFHCECGDILVRMEQSAPDGVLTGEMLLVDGQVLVARGAVSLAQDLEPMLQAPSIMLHLAFSLLEKGVPEGPASVNRKRRISIKEGVRQLDLNSGMATGTFRAPWVLKGEAWESNPGQRRFELQFEFSNPEPDDAENTDAFSFTGGQDYRRDDFPLPDATSLEGWKVQWISKGEAFTSDAPSGLTLGALRAEALALGAAESE